MNEKEKQDMIDHIAPRMKDEVEYIDEIMRRLGVSRDTAAIYSALWNIEGKLGGLAALLHQADSDDDDDWKGGK